LPVNINEDMIANNIFRAIGEFFTKVMFTPFQSIREMDNWWIQNGVNWLFLIITLVAFMYWMGELRKYKSAGEE
jgi:hypothetical protein